MIVTLVPVVRAIQLPSPPLVFSVIHFRGYKGFQKIGFFGGTRVEWSDVLSVNYVHQGGSFYGS